jgi:hydrophobe/amphiphile efflux-3 (HAE3) family protein
MKPKAPRLERALCRLARFQCRFFIPIIIISLGITALLALGLPNVRIESDFDKILPEDLPEIVFNDRISETFGATDTVFVLVRLDKECTSCLAVQDIRDPRVMRMLVDIGQSLTGKTGINTVFSPGSIFPDKPSVPESLEGINFALSQVPGSEEGFNRDYSATTVIISASVGGGQEKRNEFTQSVRNEIETVEVPPGVKLTVTGATQLEAEIFRLLEEDAVNVTLIAGLLILALLIVLLRSPLRTLQTYTPVLFSLVWTFGLLGWADIALSVATVAIGAFIIGLGIEYGIFFVKRFEEGLRGGLSADDSIEEAVCGIGSAITSSASTTMIGFIMLTLTILPIIQILGITLALSILFSLVAALLVNPAIIIAEEGLAERFRRRRPGHG